MREHVVDRVLGEAIKALALGDEVADELVEAFAFGLVGGPVGVGEEGGAELFPTFVGLNPEEKGEFDPIVAEVDRENLHENFVPDGIPNGLDGPDDGERGALVDEAAELEAELREGDGQDDLPILLHPNQGIVLDDVGLFMRCDGPFIVLVGSSDEGLDVPGPGSLVVGVLASVDDIFPKLEGFDGEVPPVAKTPDGGLGADAFEGLA